MLFEFDAAKQWRERGGGEVRVLVSAEEPQQARLVMRQKGNLRLLMNANLWVDMPVAKMEGGKVREGWDKGPGFWLWDRPPTLQPLGICHQVVERPGFAWGTRSTPARRIQSRPRPASIGVGHTQTRPAVPPPHRAPRLRW